MGVQEVGARFVVLGRTEFLAAMRAAKAEVDSLNRSLVSGAAKAKAAQISNPITALAQSIALAQKQMAADTARQYDRVAKVGKAAFFGLAGAAAVAGYEGLKVHSQFQAAMTQVTTLAGVSQTRLGALTSGIKALAPAVGQGLVPLANALYRVASTPAGLKATNAQLLQMTKYAGMLATIGGPGTDLEQTARIIGGAESTGVKGTGSPQNIVSLAAATVGSGDIRMSDFVDFLGTGVLTSGKLTGIPLPQLAAFLALAGSNLQSGQVSGHGLAHGLQLLAAPSGVAAKAMGAIGLAPTQLGQIMQTGQLGKAISTLYGALSGPLGGNANLAQLAAYGISSADIGRAQQVGFGQMGATGAADMNLILTRMFGGAKMGIPVDMLVTEAKNYNQILGHMQTQTQTFSKAWGTQTDTLSFKTHRFTSSMQDLADSIGSGLTPMAKEFLTVGADVATWLSKNTPAALALGAAITAVLGPAIGLYLVRKFRDASGAVADVVKGYAKLVRAILYQLIPSLRAEDTALGTTITEEEVAARGAGFGFVSLLGGAAAAGTASYVLSNTLSSHFDTGNANYGAASARAQIAALSSSPLVAQARSIEAKIAADKKRMAAMQNQSGVSDLFSGSAWLSAVTFGAEGKEADYNRLVGEVKQYQQQLAALQAQAAAQDINLTVNLDGKTVAKSTVKNVRQKVARS